MGSTRSELTAGTMATETKASIESTVFVRFVPPTANIRRHHLENLFSQFGPIRKSSVIVPHARVTTINNKNANATNPSPNEEQESKPPASYGFIKYTSQQDATEAAAKLDYSTIRLSDTESITLRVERASDATAAKGIKNYKRKNEINQEDDTEDNSKKNNDMDKTKNTKANRLILRNLSFHARELSIRKVLESQFGKVLEVHIPQVPGKDHSISHRGFCFVTFEQAKDAKACLRHSKDIIIQKRAVSVAEALNKTMYESQQRKNEKKNEDYNKGEHRDADDKKNKVDDDDDYEEVDHDKSDDKVDTEYASGDSESDLESADDDQNDDDDDRDHEGNDDHNSQNRGNNGSHRDIRDDNAVSDRRAVFVRNIPFDANRHDLFELFRCFGYITGIFIVKDKETGIPRGTAFVYFQSRNSVEKALEAAKGGNDSFISQREAAEGQGVDISDGLILKGRKIFINEAVKKDLAETLVMAKSSERQSAGKDRRNLYLQGEGRVDNDEKKNKMAWDDLPEQDKAKRQRAWSEKNTKLRSPIFFINPLRLSIRNLAKHVDEQKLKKLCSEATKRGVDRKLVHADDMIAHWRASGDMNTRELMEKAQNAGDSIIPAFDMKNLRRHIPSVFIERDFSGKKSDTAPSRGFGFVEFEHHAHALACLRELNNNTLYSEDYASGGKHAIDIRKKSKKTPKIAKNVADADLVGGDGHVKVPRLIVEFTVENKAKARLQAENRAQQQANKIKQKIENKEKMKTVKDAKEKKKSRGARQRERKRKGLQDGADSSDAVPTKEARAEEREKQNDEQSPELTAANRSRAVRPPKKRKTDEEESHFEKLVASYETKFVENDANAVTETYKKSKKWFDE